MTDRSLNRPPSAIEKYANGLVHDIVTNDIVMGLGTLGELEECTGVLVLQIVFQVGCIRVVSSRPPLGYSIIIDDQLESDVTGEKRGKAPIDIHREQSGHHPGGHREYVTGLIDLKATLGSAVQDVRKPRWSRLARIEARQQRIDVCEDLHIGRAVSVGQLSDAPEHAPILGAHILLGQAGLDDPTWRSVTTHPVSIGWKEGQDGVVKGTGNRLLQLARFSIAGALIVQGHQVAAENVLMHIDEHIDAVLALTINCS